MPTSPLGSCEKPGKVLHQAMVLLKPTSRAAVRSKRTVSHLDHTLHMGRSQCSRHSLLQQVSVESPLWAGTVLGGQ